MAEDAVAADFRIEHPAWAGLEAALAAAIAEAARAEAAQGEVDVLLADDAALHALNRQWRGKDKPTNVLSFPSEDSRHLGDIALAAETVAAEAEAQGKSFERHATHLIVHGFLHLLGYDHETETDAAIMEDRERAILAALGAPDPYAELADGL